jgi:hypothetical protein
MRTGGPASADSAHTSMESAPLPVRLAENGLTADAGKKERLQGNSQAWGTPHHGDKPHAVRAQKRRGDSGTAQGIWRNRRDKPPMKGAALEPFQACSGFSQENGTGAHTLYRIYRFGRAILLLNRVKILKKRCYEAQKEEISPYTEAKRSVEK